MIIARLLKPKVPLWRYCLEAWPISLIPSLLLAGSALALAFWFADAGALSRPSPPKGIVHEFIVGGVIGPVIETLLLALLITLLGRFTRKPLAIAIAAGLIWGTVHAIAAPLWFFGPAWGFFVYSCGYLAWRPHSLRSALVAASVPHVLKNLTVTALMLLDSARGLVPGAGVTY